MALNSQHEKVINDPQAIIASKGKAETVMFPMDSSDYNFFSLTFKEFKYATAAKQKKYVVKEQIILPLPTNGLQDSLQLSYDSMDLGALMGTAAKEIAGSIDTIGAAMSSGGTFQEKGFKAMNAYIGEVRKKIKSGASKMKDMKPADAAAAVAAAVGGGGDIAAVIGNALGQAPNPHITAIFRGVNLRDFSFTFKLIPNNEQEAYQINKLTNIIRQRSLPIRNKTTGGLTLNYPHEAHLALLTGSMSTGAAMNTILFKPCHVTSVAINHTSEGVQFYRDGQPLGRDLTLSFKEIDFWRGDDYDPSKGGGTLPVGAVQVGPF